MLGGEPPAPLSLPLIQRSTWFLEELQNVCFLEEQRIVAASLFQFTAKESVKVQSRREGSREPII